MTKPDTSPEAIAALLEGVTAGPWGFVAQDDFYTGEWHGCGVRDAADQVLIWFDDDPSVDDPTAKFIAAARDLVPALAAERDALLSRAEKAEIDAEFFKGEVKLRNRIPATGQEAADLQREVERLTAEVTQLKAELKEARVSAQKTLQEALTALRGL